MTRTQFRQECDQRLIDWHLAAENEDIRAALAARDDEEVKRLLDEEF